VTNFNFSDATVQHKQANKTNAWMYGWMDG